MTTANTHIFSNSRDYLEGVARGIGLVNDSAINTSDVASSEHPCFAYVLPITDNDADEPSAEHHTLGESVNMSATAFRLFYGFSNWLPDGAYFDDCIIKENGKVITDIITDDIPQSSIITIEYGYIYDKDGTEIGRVQDAARAWLARNQ